MTSFYFFPFTTGERSEPEKFLHLFFWKKKFGMCSALVFFGKKSSACVRFGIFFEKKSSVRFGSAPFFGKKVRFGSAKVRQSSASRTHAEPNFFTEKQIKISKKVKKSSAKVRLYLFSEFFF